MRCLLNFFLTDIIADRYAEILLEDTGEVAGGKPGVGRKRFNGDAFFDVAVNIINTLHDWFGKDRTFFLQDHFSCKIFGHNVVQIRNLTD